MKKIVVILFSILISISLVGQKKLDSKKINQLYAEKLSSYDLSNLWMSSSEDILGFIGDNYQRLQLHYISIKKDTVNPNVYHVKGKSKVKNNICYFEGIITVIKVEEFKIELENNEPNPFYNPDTTRLGELTATYSFAENQNQEHSGIFEGLINTNFYIDIFYKIHLDDLDMGGMDSYCNNQFKGIWTSYDKKYKKKCNWGDVRIPDCGDLDVGTGEFVPNEKYRKNGWEDYCWYCTYKQIEKNKKLSNWWK